MPDLLNRTLKERYHVRSQIGRGGMAEVYKVWDSQRGAFLALKLLKPELQRDRELMAAFQEEARTLEELSHPSIVRFYGLEQDGGQSFFLMDFVEGDDLRRLIQRQPEKMRSHAWIRKVFHPVCSALQFAHRKGYVHCDIKPANIMISRQKMVFLTDFGLTRARRDVSRLAGAAGTPAYMAPEQVAGQPPTPAMDLYALGVVLFEMASGGHRPYEGDRATVGGSLSERIRWEVNHLEPYAPGHFNPAIKPGLEAVILKALQRDPAQRYASAEQLSNAIERVLDQDTVSNEEEAKGEDEKTIKPKQPLRDCLTRLVKRNGFLPVALGLAVVLIIALIALNAGGGAGGSRMLRYTDKCMSAQVDVSRNAWISECVDSLSVNADGHLLVGFSWHFSSSDPALGVTIPPDTNNRNMYLSDDLGNRLDHISTGGGADQSITLYNGNSKSGWFIFPALSPSASYFIFHDDDNGLQTQPIGVDW